MHIYSRMHDNTYKDNNRNSFFFGRTNLFIDYIEGNFHYDSCKNAISQTSKFINIEKIAN